MKGTHFDHSRKCASRRETINKRQVLPNRSKANRYHGLNSESLVAELVDTLR